MIIPDYRCILKEVEEMELRAASVHKLQGRLKLDVLWNLIIELGVLDVDDWPAWTDSWGFPPDSY